MNFIYCAYNLCEIVYIVYTMKKQLVTYDAEKVNKARTAALSLTGAKSSGKFDIEALMHSDNLLEIEQGIRDLNTFATKATLLSSYPSILA